MPRESTLAKSRWLPGHSIAPNRSSWKKFVRICRKFPALSPRSASRCRIAWIICSRARAPRSRSNYSGRIWSHSEIKRKKYERRWKRCLVSWIFSSSRRLVFPNYRSRRQPPQSGCGPVILPMPWIRLSTEKRCRRFWRTSVPTMLWFDSMMLRGNRWRQSPHR